jgi:hypothetical protein
MPARGQGATANTVFGSESVSSRAWTNESMDTGSTFADLSGWNLPDIGTSGHSVSVVLKMPAPNVATPVNPSLQVGFPGVRCGCGLSGASGKIVRTSTELPGSSKIRRTKE